MKGAPRVRQNTGYGALFFCFEARYANPSATCVKTGISYKTRGLENAKFPLLTGFAYIPGYETPQRGNFYTIQKKKAPMRMSPFLRAVQRGRSAPPAFPGRNQEDGDEHQNQGKDGHHQKRDIQSMHSRAASVSLRAAT